MEEDYEGEAMYGTEVVYKGHFLHPSVQCRFSTSLQRDLSVFSSNICTVHKDS